MFCDVATTIISSTVAHYHIFAYRNVSLLNIQEFEKRSGFDWLVICLIECTSYYTKNSLKFSDHLCPRTHVFKYRTLSHAEYGVNPLRK